MSEDMSPYCSAHDEWLIRKLCWYVGYHDANNVSNFGGDPVTKIIWAVEIRFVLCCFTGTAHHSRDAATGFGLLLRDHAQAAGVWKTDAGHTSLSTALYI